jgi:hypothetical protein
MIKTMNIHELKILIKQSLEQAKISLAESHPMEIQQTGDGPIYVMTLDRNAETRIFRVEITEAGK